jgi:outer membrane receptor for ferrienterochelin and colicins
MATEKETLLRRLAFACMLPILFANVPQALAAQLDANEPEDFFEMSIEKLLDIEVTVASKKSEPTVETPGVVVVVPRNEIELYGDRNLHQLLQRQPSVYTRGSYLYPHNLASFRGNMATHLDLHTLLLINGRPIRDSSFGGVNFPANLTTVDIGWCVKQGSGRALRTSTQGKVWLNAPVIWAITLGTDE